MKRTVPKLLPSRIREPTQLFLIGVFGRHEKTPTASNGLRSRSLFPTEVPASRVSHSNIEVVAELCGSKSFEASGHFIIPESSKSRSADDEAIRSKGLYEIGIKQAYFCQR